MAAIKVYGAAYSTAAARVLATLHEKGLDYELVHVDMTTGEHKTESYISRNVRTLCFKLLDPRLNKLNLVRGHLTFLLFAILFFYFLGCFCWNVIFWCF